MAPIGLIVCSARKGRWRVPSMNEIERPHFVYYSLESIRKAEGGRVVVETHASARTE